MGIKMKFTTALLAITVLSATSISFAAPGNKLTFEEVQQYPLKHSKSVVEFDDKFKKYMEKTIKKDRQIIDLSQEEKNEWEILYQDLDEVIKLSQTKSIQIGPKKAAAYDGSSAGFSSLKAAIEASMDTNDYGSAYAIASKSAADTAAQDQATYMSQHGYTQTLDNIVDAFRHFSWNYHLTDTWYVTRSQAKGLTDNHEFAEKGAYYAYNNWPTSSDSWQVYQGTYYANKLKGDCLNPTTGQTTFFNTFGPSSYMDFNNNDAGRAWEAKSFSNNFDAFDDAVSNSAVTTSPSQWTADFLKYRAYFIYDGTFKY